MTIQSFQLSRRLPLPPSPLSPTLVFLLHVLMWNLSSSGVSLCVRGGLKALKQSSRIYMYFNALSQGNGRLLKSSIVKVNKQQLGFSVADWKGNNFVAKAEGVCVDVCLHRRVCVRAFHWGFLLAPSLPADLSVLVSIQGCEMTLCWAHLELHYLFQLRLLFPNYVLFHFPPPFSLLYIQLPHLIHSLVSLSPVLALTSMRKITHFLFLSRDLMFPVCKASIRST